MSRQQLYNMASFVVQGHKVSTPHELYCTACGKVLLRDRDMTFTTIKGGCDCSWNCCEAARPTGKPHANHMAYRPQDDEHDATPLNTPYAGER